MYGRKIVMINTNVERDVHIEGLVHNETNSKLVTRRGHVAIDPGRKIVLISLSYSILYPLSNFHTTPQVSSKWSEVVAASSLLS